MITIADVLKSVEIPDCDCPPIWFGEYRDMQGRLQSYPLGADRKKARKKFDAKLRELEAEAFEHFLDERPGVPHETARRHFLDHLNKNDFLRYESDITFAFPRCEHVTGVDANYTDPAFFKVFELADYTQQDKDKQHAPVHALAPEPMLEPIRQRRVSILAWRHAHGFAMHHPDDLHLDDVKAMTLEAEERYRNGADRPADLRVFVEKADDEKKRA